MILVVNLNIGTIFFAIHDGFNLDGLPLADVVSFVVKVRLVFDLYRDGIAGPRAYDVHALVSVGREDGHLEFVGQGDGFGEVRRVVGKQFIVANLAVLHLPLVQ